MTDAVLDKIQKLLAMAEGTENELEAQAFFDRAEKLMLKYAIDEAVLDAARTKAGGVKEVPVQVVFEYSANEANKPGKVSLLSALGRAHGVKVVYLGGGPKYRGAKRTQRAYLLGFQTDIDFVKLLYTSLVLQGESGAASAYKRTGGDGFSSRYVWMREFFDGFVSVAGRRVREARERAAQELRVDAAPGTDLVLVDRGAAVEAAYAEAFPRLGKMRTGGRSSAYGANGAGRTAGERADISGGRGHLGGSRTALR